MRNPLELRNIRKFFLVRNGYTITDESCVWLQEKILIPMFEKLWENVNTIDGLINNFKIYFGENSELHKQLLDNKASYIDSYPGEPERAFNEFIFYAVQEVFIMIDSVIYSNMITSLLNPHIICELTLDIVKKCIETDMKSQTPTMKWDVLNLSI